MGSSCFQDQEVLLKKWPLYCIMQCPFIALSGEYDLDGM
jgi:hypothetical protein